MKKNSKGIERREKLIAKAKSEIETFARSIGFDLVGFSQAKIDKKYFDIYKKWLGKGMNAGMEYMAKSAQRKDASKILPNAKTVISLGINYFHPQENQKLSQEEGIIARYAYGRDYHKIISKKLKQLEAYMKEKFPNDFTKSYVDTGPILERAYAETSGLGQIGKNGCIITKTFGSWIFLSEIITTVELTTGIGQESFRTNIPQAPLVAGRGRLKETFLTNSICGSCTRCIDACPTKAIIAPGIIDARKCISYQTIENKGHIPKRVADAIKKTKRIFGCDICQEVCPHNMGKQKITTHSEFLQRIAGDKIPIKKILTIKSDEEFLHTYAGSPLMRAKLRKLASTAKIIAS